MDVHSAYDMRISIKNPVKILMYANCSPCNVYICTPPVLIDFNVELIRVRIIVIVINHNACWTHRVQAIIYVSQTTARQTPHSRVHIPQVFDGI